MSLAGRILLATSIAPTGRLEIQQAALSGWIAQGFDILSVNARDEVALLEPHFPDVVFRNALRTARLITGRSHVFVNDILRVLAESDRPIVGIVNSDVRPEDISDLHGRLGALAADALVCAPRLDVDAWDDRDGKADRFGFDLFVFPSRLIPLWPETRFCLGQGFWDHWLPLQVILAGIAAVKLWPPVIRHVRHAIARDENFFVFADEFAILMTGHAVPADRAGPEDFGYGLPGVRYADLRAAAQSGNMRDLEAFAGFIDELSRHVVRYIDRACASKSLYGR